MPRGPVRQRLYRLAYPVVGYGPPPLNRLALHPELFAYVPKRLRRRLARRILRAGGSPWLRAQVDGKVQVTEERTVMTLARSDGGLVLGLSDGSAREADAVILSTGFRFSLDRLSFLSPAVRDRIAVRDGWPVLDRSFRSSDPDLFFVGYRRGGPVRADLPLRAGHQVHRAPGPRRARRVAGRSRLEAVPGARRQPAPGQDGRSRSGAAGASA